MSTMTSASAALALLATLSSSSPATAEDCADTGLGELGFPLIEHSCFHTTNGPFLRVTATPGPTASPATADVDEVHTHYTVALTPGQPNVVVYTPARSGTWAIFTETAFPLAVIDPRGVALTPRLTHAVTGCTALPQVQVYLLTGGQRYTLRLGDAALTASSTILELEKVSDFDTLHGRDVDGDGFGGQADTLTTPCVPPAGYVRDTTDCNDADAEVSPSAAERCDGTDNNCNGLADEEVCELGGGGCRAAEGPDPESVLAAALLLLAGAARLCRRTSKP